MNKIFGLTSVLIFCILGCKSEEELQFEKDKLEVEKMKVALEKEQLERIKERDGREKAAEVSPAIGTYEKLAEVYLMEVDTAAYSFETIGYIPPSSPNFSYSASNKGISAISKVDLGTCPRGTEWKSEAIVSSKKEMTFVRTISNSACEELTPNFRKH